MTKARKPPPEPEAETPASLLSDESRGGPTAIKGFDFQRRYALILLLESLPDPNWTAVLVEGAEDVEARFDRQGRIERHAIQLKNYRLTAGRAKEIVDHLKKLDDDSPGTWTDFVIACTELDDTLKTIHNGLQRYRPSGAFYTADDAILANTRAVLEAQIPAANLPAAFVLDRVTFQPGLQSYNQEDWVRARALTLLQEDYPGISHATAEAIYLRLARLVSESTAIPITRPQVEQIIAAERLKAPEAERKPGPEGYTPPPLPPDPNELPEPGPLPPGSRVPFTRNALFTGRHEPLLDLAQALLHGEAASTLITQAIQGMGGIGKTQLAVEFAYRYGRFFHGVHWLHCAQPAAINSEIATCGAAMDLAAWPQELPEQVRLTLQAWQQDGSHLVVLDNLESVDAAREWLPCLTGGRVRLLLTARRADWPRDLGLDPHRLDSFSPAESLAFLRQYVPPDRAPDADLDQLARRLGHLPLALELAGRYLERLPRLSVPDYHDRLADILNHRSFTGFRTDLGNPTGHDLGLAATFFQSWQRVKDDTARRLFLLAGHCAPNQPIPCGLLEAALRAGEPAGLRKRIGKLFSKKRSLLEFDQALDLLTGTGLLEMDDPRAGPTIHPLLAEYGRTLPRQQRALPALAAALASQAHEANETGLPARFVPLRPHMEVAAPAAQDAGLEKAATLWNNLAYHRRMVADYAGALAAYERALAIDEAAFGPNHPKITIRVNNLGGVLQDLGDLAAARAAFERALAIDEAAFERALAIHEATFDAGHSVATDVNNLGGVLQDQGDLAGARAAYERALAIWTKAYGEDHILVGTAHNNLGSVLWDLGDLAGARAAFERVLGILDWTLPRDHPYAAATHNNLGSVLRALGDLAGARAAYERALAIWTDVYGEDHPQVAIGHSNLGMVLQALGDLAGARAAYERALAIRERALGRRHPDTAQSLWWLGTLAYQTGDLESAQSYLEEALEIFEAFLPAQHPRVQKLRASVQAVRAQLGQDP